MRRDSSRFRSLTTLIAAGLSLTAEGAELTEQFVAGPYRFEILEGTSHWVPERAAEALNELLREHFAPFVR